MDEIVKYVHARLLRGYGPGRQTDSLELDMPVVVNAENAAGATQDHSREKDQAYWPKQGFAERLFHDYALYRQIAQSSTK